MFDSRSLHGSSFRDPRVILFGADAKFIVSFNGEPGQRGYLDLETMEYDETTHAFAYREIHFPGRDDAQSRVIISPVNPPRCRACHGTPARPLWDTFPNWPGAYGEHYFEKLSQREAAGLAGFLDQQQSHPRYRYLVDADRLSLEGAYSPTPATLYNATSREPPNARLSMLLGRLNFAALVAGIERADGFNRWRFALLASLDVTCGPPKENVPFGVIRAFTEPFEEFARGTAVVDRRQSELKSARSTTPDDRISRARSAESIDGFRYLVEQGLKISTRAWTTAFEKPSYDFSMPGSAAAELERQLLATLPRDDAALAALADARSVSNSDRYCAELRRRSRAELTNPEESAKSVGPPIEPRSAELLPNAGNPPITLEQCTLCHRSGIAPDLPFDRPDRLAEELSHTGYSHGTLLDEILFRLSAAAGPHRMPLGTTLSSAEGDELEKYLHTLAQHE